MGPIVTFAKTTFGTVLLTVLAVFLAEKFLKTDLKGVPGALKAKVA